MGNYFFVTVGKEFKLPQHSGQSNSPSEGLEPHTELHDYLGINLKKYPEGGDSG